MPPLKVLITGASIAGPTAAYWLSRAGATITIIERYPQLRTGGQNIDIRTAGVTVMRRMAGLEASVRAASTQMQGISFVRSSGRPYGTIRATGNPDQQSLVSEYEIFRGDLARILLEMTRGDERVRYVFGEQVLSMRQAEKGPVYVEFRNGFQAQEFDLVVACDGATSRTRAMGLGCGPREFVHSSGCWAAYFSIKDDLLDGGKVAKGYSAPGGRFIGVGPDPAGGNRVGMQAINCDAGALLPFREASRVGGDEALKAFVAKHYAGAGWKYKEIMEGLRDADDFYASEIVQVKVPALYKGRFVMVGDAGYAAGFTGGGTTLALAGAYVLAGEIAKCRGDLDAGLRGYEETMRPLITEMQKVPPFVTTFLAPQSAWGVWIRNYVFAFIAWTRILEVVQRFFAGAFASTEKFPLPEYEWVN